MDDLSTWLLEQVAMDEAAAAEMRYNAGTMSDCGEPHDESIVALKGKWTFDATRLLAECEAKRSLIRWVLNWPMRPSRPSSVDGVLERLALPYADRPGYQESWRP